MRNEKKIKIQIYFLKFKKVLSRVKQIKKRNKKKNLNENHHIIYFDNS